MTKSSGISRSRASERIEKGDFDNPQPWEINQKRIHEQLRKLGKDIYDNLDQIVQNAFDATDIGQPTKVSISTQVGPIIVEDRGPKGLLKDYSNINKFIQAQKAASEKLGQEGTTGEKGVGMFQYLNIGPEALLTSMDHKGMIHRIPLGVKDGYNSWGDYESFPVTKENMEERGIYSPGTIVTIFGCDEKIDPSELRDRLKESWAMRMYWLEQWDMEHKIPENDRMEVVSDGLHIQPPGWLYQHPPQPLFDIKVEGKVYTVHGNLWESSRGHGDTKIYVKGHKIEHMFRWGDRQFEGYLECNELQTNIDRTHVIMEDYEAWNQLDSNMSKLAAKFPLTEKSETDVRNKKKFEEILYERMKDLVDPHVTYSGDENEPTKEETTGDRGKGIVGYLKKLKSKKDKKKVKRKFKGRDENNVSQVDTENKDKDVIAESEQTDNKRENRPFLCFFEPQGADKPLMNYNLEKKILYINTDNAEYPYLKHLITGTSTAKLLDQFLDERIAEIAIWKDKPDVESREAVDIWRMELSNSRVDRWKRQRVYPLESKVTSEEPHK